MKSLARRFNIIFMILAALLMVGCSSADKKKDKKDKKKDKQATALRFHLEVNRDGTPYNGAVPIQRSNPILVNVERTPILDENNLRKAEVVAVDDFGGFAIKLTFNERGTFYLDNLTTQHKGRRLAVFCHWTEDRWLAAPIIKKRIPDGVLVFTPDANREEAERIVAGLNNVIKTLGKPYTLGSTPSDK